MFKLSKILLCAFLVAVCSTMATAQNFFGVQVGYGSEIEKVSFGANFEFFVAPKVSISPNFAFYLPVKQDVGGGDEIVIKFWELNADGHFYLSRKEEGSFYGIVGINYVHAKAEFPDVFGFPDETDSETGLNLGFGGIFGKGNAKPFFEFKYETIDDGQLVFLGGVRFLLK